MTKYLVTVRYSDGRADKVTNCSAEHLRLGWESLGRALVTKPEGVVEVIINKVND